MAIFIFLLYFSTDTIADEEKKYYNNFTCNILGDTYQREHTLHGGRMRESGKMNRIWSDIRFFFAAAIVLVLFFLIFEAVRHHNSIMDAEPATDYSKAWSYEDGSPVDLNNLRHGERITIMKKIDDEVVDDLMLCFFSKNIYFTVYMDGDALYDFHPKPPAIFGKTYGVFPHTVNLPVMYEDSTLTIIMDNIYPDNPGFIRGMVLDHGSQFLIQSFQGSTGDFLLCLIVFGFGVVLFIIGVIGRYFGENRFEIISVGTFAMVAAVWVISETSILPVVTGSPIPVHFMDYIALDLLPLPGIMFATAVAGERKSKLVLIFGVLTAVKIIGSVISTACGGLDYHQLLSFTHVLLGLTVVAVVTVVVRGIMKGMIRRKLKLVFFLSLIFSLIMGVVDIVRYILDPHAYNRASYYKYGLFFFIFMCGVYEIIMISELSRRGQYAEIMEEMANRDGLTGLLNRMAFNREIAAAAKEEKNRTLIMVDLNDLKGVNDKMGHDQGDAYIVKIAECMREAFSHGEQCFRIGGDEFFIMTDYTNADPILEESVQAMKAGVEKFNSEFGYEIPLQFAYGYSEFVPGTDIEEEIRTADQRMYEMKTEMKAGV